jgi:MFS family permease
MLPSTVAMMLAGPLSGRLSSTVGSRVPLILGSLVASISFAFLALAHSSGWEVYLSMFVFGFGIGLAFSSMANLIVESVSPEQTGVATGMNTIVRTIGGGVGSQVSAGIIAAALIGGLPTEHGFVLAFAVSSGALAVGFLVALAIPRPVRAIAPLAGRGAA